MTCYLFPLIHIRIQRASSALNPSYLTGRAREDTFPATKLQKEMSPSQHSGPVGLVEFWLKLTKKTLFLLNCYERKTLFRLKKENEQAEYGVSRTEGF